MTMPTNRDSEDVVNAYRLEPRVVKLEAGLDRLTEDVRSLASIIRQQGENTEKQIQDLTVAVTQAAAPRKTDWSLLLSVGFFILALGSAVFWPLNKQTTDNKEQIEKYHASMVEHQKLDMHPVGLARVETIEKTIAVDKSELVARDAALDTKIQRETQLMTDILGAKIAAVDERHQMEMKLRNELLDQKIATVKDKYDLFFDKLYGRVVVLEQLERDHEARDSDELRQLKMKLMTGELKTTLSQHSKDK